MHHAWLLVGPEGIGKATLAYRFARAVLAEVRCGRRARPRSRPSGVPQSRGDVASESSSHPALLGREIEALLAMDRRRGGTALARFSRPFGGRSGLARGDGRPRRRTQPERGQRAAEGSRGAAAADAVPAGLERRGSVARHHPLAPRDASRHGLEDEDLQPRYGRRLPATVTRPTTRRLLPRWRSGGKRAARARTCHRATASSSIARSSPRSAALPEIDGAAAARLVDRLAGRARATVSTFIFLCCSG